MRKPFLILITTSYLFLFPLILKAQTDIYSASGWEMPFQFAAIDYNDNESGSVMRFAPFLNIHSYINFDFGRAVGLFSGIGIRNVGFIHEIPSSVIKKKYRTYNVAIPAGIKLGNMKKGFIFGGYEIEFPIHYKEKTFENEVKNERKSVWFTERTPVFYNTAFVGIQFKYGFNIRFKYYLTGFFNKDFIEVIDGVETKPFEFYDVNIFYVSLSFSMFRNAKFYYKGYNIEHDF